MELSEKDGRVVVVVSENMNIHERRTFQSILKRTEKNFWAILVVIALNFFSPFSWILLTDMANYNYQLGNQCNWSFGWF